MEDDSGSKLRTLCNPNVCNSKQKILEDGTCENCPEKNIQSKDKMKCYPNCPIDQVILDGDCAKCPDYSHPDDDRFSCVKDPCLYNETKDIEGRCFLRCPSKGD